MLYNFLSVSGVVTSVSGNDAYAPYPYWNTYTYRQLTQTEIDRLKNNDFTASGVYLSPGQYTCLEISVSGGVYLGVFRSYFYGTTNSYDIGLAFKQDSFPTTSGYIYCNDTTITREDVRNGLAPYWQQVSGCYGYFESDPFTLEVGHYIDLYDALYYTTYSGTPSGVTSHSGPSTIKQLVYTPVEFSDTQSTRLQVAASDTPLHFDSATIAPLNVTQQYYHPITYSDHDVRGDIRYWRAGDDDNTHGHFEGQDIVLDVGTEVSGTWNYATSWSGSVSKSERAGLEGYTIRQLLPASQLTASGDGLRVTLSGSAVSPLTIRSMSYMQSSPNSITLDFSTNSQFEQVDIKGDIDRWKNDGYVSGVDYQNVIETVLTDQIDIEKSRHFGHFEGAAVDFDDGEEAIMYSANVIGFKCNNHGLSAGDRIAIYGTTYYDGIYLVLTYSTAHIVVIWGIYDPEIFTSEAKIRKILSLGPQLDDYGETQDCQDIVPYVQVNFIDGTTSYIINYSGYGDTYYSVELGDDIDTLSITSIYDVVLDSGYLSSTPGPSAGPEYETSMPDPFTGKFKSRRSFHKFLDSSYDHGDPGWGYEEIAAEDWGGIIWTITEDEDNDWSDWEPTQFFDGVMAQPWYALNDVDSDCPWVTLCYRGPEPVKFFIDMDTARVFNKYRLWVQLSLCPTKPRCDYIVSVSKPRSWKVQGSNIKSDDDTDWTTLHEVTDYDPDNFVPTEYPPDKRVPGSCANSSWLTFTNPDMYRYYRIYIEEAWIESPIPDNRCRAQETVETNHICEMDFCERRAAPGLFPVIITSDQFFDRVDSVNPQEHMLSGSTAYYTVSFDSGTTWKVYRSDSWVDVVRNSGAEWQYYHNAWNDATTSNARRALWQAFSTYHNRMTADDLRAIPSSAYAEMMPSGGYIQFGVGLVSKGRIESMLTGITINGSIFSPSGITAPTEITFGGQTGCYIGSGELVSSDWINTDVSNVNNALFAIDIDTTYGVIPFFNYISTDVGRIRYYERDKYISYDEQAANVSDYNMQSGVVLIESLEIRNSDLVLFSAAGNTLFEGHRITLAGTTNYDGFHEIEYVDDYSFGFSGKHYLETIISGTIANRLISIAQEGADQPDVQVGSMLEFGGTGYYQTTSYEETTPSGLYFITENYCVPGMEATHLFDTSSTVEFHSGQPIKNGPILIGIYLVDIPLAYNQIRFRSSYNYYYWDKEFPQVIVIEASSKPSPALSTNSDWTVVASGQYALPAGPGRWGDMWEFNNVTAYNHYRVRFDSIYGDDTDCVRLGQIELVQSGAEFSGFTLVEAKQGFDSSYLYDGSTYTQFVSEASLLTSPVYIEADFRGKTRQVTRFSIASVKEAVSTSGTALVSAQAVSPKVISLWYTTSGSAPLTSDAYWNRLLQVTYDEPSMVGTYGDYIDVAHPPLGAIATIQGPDSTIRSYSSLCGLVDLNRQLQNGQVIKRVGMWPYAHDLYVMLCKDIGDELHFDVTVIALIPYTGSFSWVTLDCPIMIPETGTYYLGMNTTSPDPYYRNLGRCNFSADTTRGIRYTSTYNASGDSIEYSSYDTSAATSLALEYMGDSEVPTGMSRLKFKVSSVWGGSSYHCEMADIDIVYDDQLTISKRTTYSEVYPIKLMDLPKDTQLTGMEVTTITGTYGGYVSQVGYTATSGNFVNSFWTIVDRHEQLLNRRSIADVGLYSDLGSSVNLRIFKQCDTSAEWFDITDIATLTHSGGGLQWFKLSEPYEIPEEGDYYLGWYQPNYPRIMGDTTGSGLVSYEYGDLTGTLVNLPYHDNQHPILGVRYAGYYTVGTEAEPAAVINCFSPGRSGSSYTSDITIGPVTSGTSIYLFQPVSFISPNTRGELSFLFYFEDPDESSYEAPLITATDNGSYSPNDKIDYLMDGTFNNTFASYRRAGEAQYLSFIVRFDEPAYLSAFRAQVAGDRTQQWKNRFPDFVTIGGAISPQNPLSSAGWDDLYQNSGYVKPKATGSYLPWMYFDDYSSSYKYYLFNFCHLDYREDYCRLGELGLISRQTLITENVTIDTLGMITSVDDAGIDSSSVEVLYPPGNRRAVSSIYNTFTSSGITELSPGSYFYYGEHNQNEYSSFPSLILKTTGSGMESVGFVSQNFAEMNMIAWHVLDEEYGVYEDYSGNGVTATGIDIEWVETQRGGYGSAVSVVADDDTYQPSIVCTLPARMTDYTVAFWFKPTEKFYSGADVCDIMGGWTSLGAIPGNWHISFSQNLLFNSSPYPYLQYADNDSNHLGTLVFGNYGKVVHTSRRYWSDEEWHHVAFGFRSDGTFRVWIDGAREVDSYTQSSDVYPCDNSIMVDPTDIHYATHDYRNCMYFGLPLKGSIGVQGEFGLSNVMHFNKLLNDNEAFNLYRFKTDAENKTGIYFTQTQTMELPSTLVLYYPDPVCITKTALSTPTNIVDQGKVAWEIMASGVDGWKSLYSTYSSLPSLTTSVEEKTLVKYISPNSLSELFIFDKNTTLQNIRVEILEDFTGGYMNPIYPFTSDEIGVARNATAGYTYVTALSNKRLPAGTYISCVGVSSTTTATGVKVKIAAASTETRSSTTPVTLRNLTTLTVTGGLTWKTLDQLEPINDPSFIGLYSPVTLSGAWGYNGMAGWATGCRLGDVLGNYTLNDFSLERRSYDSLRVFTYFANRYVIDSAVGNLLPEFTAASGNTVTWSGSLQLGVGESISMVAVNPAVNDTAGLARVTATYTEHSDNVDIVWHNFLNNEECNYYMINLLGTETCSSGIQLAGIHAAAVPLVNSVSGTYSTTVSGISDTESVICFSPNVTLGESEVTFRVSRNGVTKNLTDMSITDWWVTGSGTFTLESMFSSAASTTRPAVNYYNITSTDWSIGSETTLFFSGDYSCDLSASGTSWSDWAAYSLPEYSIITFSGVTGNLMASSGVGYWINNVVAGENTVFIGGIEGRKNEVIRLSLEDTVVTSGTLVYLGPPFYSDIYSVVAASGNQFCISYPFSSILQDGGYIRKVVNPEEVAGHGITINSTLCRVDYYSDYLVTLSSAQPTNNIDSAYVTTTIGEKLSINYQLPVSNITDEGPIGVIPLNMTSNTTPTPYTVKSAMSLTTTGIVVNYSDAFPKRLMTLTSGSIVKSVGIEYGDPFIGGGVQHGYGTPTAGYNNAFAGTWTTLNFSLLPGYKLVGATLWSDSTVEGLKFKLVRLAAYATADSSCVYHLNELGQFNHSGSGEESFYFGTPVIVPTVSGTCHLAVYLPSSAAHGFLSGFISGGTGSLGTVEDITEGVVSCPYYGASYSLQMWAIYEPYFTIADTASGVVWANFTSTSGQATTTYGPFGPYDRNEEIFLHWNNSCGSLSAGKLTVNITPEECGHLALDNNLLTLVSTQDLIVNLGAPTTFDHYRLLFSTVSGNELTIGEGALNESTSKLTPDMTSDLSPLPWVVSSSSVLSSSYHAYEAFDNTNTGETDCWHSAYGSDAWLQLYCGEDGYVVNKYRLKSRYAFTTTRWPTSWVLKGSNDEKTWAELDSRSVPDPGTNTYTTWFTFYNAVQYSYYRFDFTGASYIAVGLIEFIEAESYTFDSSSVNGNLHWELYGTNTLPVWNALTENSFETQADGWSSIYSLPGNYQHYAWRFSTKLPLQELQFLYTGMTLASGMGYFETTSGYNYSYLGRLVNVNVISTEPVGTEIYHTVSFDGGVNYAVYKDNSWVNSIRNSGGDWQYYSNSWINATVNTKFGAMRRVVDTGGYLMTSEQLEAIEESSWHTDTSVTSSSGNIRFLGCLMGTADYTPYLEGYQIVTYTRASEVADQDWATSLVPSGYGLQRVGPTSNYKNSYLNLPLNLLYTNEVSYDRKYIDTVRVYLASPSGCNISELAFLDCQLPNDTYYLETFTYPTSDADTTSSGNVISILSDEHIKTGGIIITESSSCDCLISNIPSDLGLFYGELRAYYEDILDKPQIVSVAPTVEELLGKYNSLYQPVSSTSGIVFSPQLYDAGDHYKISFWSYSPASNMALRVSNTNPVGSGVVRLNELAIFYLEHTQVTSPADIFNLFEQADIKNISAFFDTSVSGSNTTYLGTTRQSLSTPHLERLFNSTVSGGIPLFPRSNIILEASTEHIGGKVGELRIYTNTNSGVIIDMATQCSGVWSTYTPTWNSGIYSWSFSPPRNVTKSRIGIINTLSGTATEKTVWIEAIQLVNSGEEVDFGTTGSGTGEVILNTYYGTYETMQIYNNSCTNRYADARILPRYTNDYDLDRTLRISEDGETWSSIGVGVNLPEDYSFDMGEFNSTYLTEEGRIALVDTATSGTWVSPIIEVMDPSALAAYVYCRNLITDDSYVNIDHKSVMNIIEVRASNTPPSQSFLVSAVQSDTGDGAQLPWKLIAFDSDGSLSEWYHKNGMAISTSTLSKGTLTNKYLSPYRQWPYSTRQPLWQFYGAMMADRYAGISLGQQYTYAVGLQGENWYKFYSIFPQDTYATTSDLDDEVDLHVYPRTNDVLFTVFSKPLRYTMRNGKTAWQIVDVVYRPVPFYERYEENYYSDSPFQLRNIYATNGGSVTPEPDIEIDYVSSLPATYDSFVGDGTRFAACIDNQGDGGSYWFHVSDTGTTEAYFTLLINGTSVVSTFTSVEKKFNYMVEGAPTATRGFWGIEEAAIHWYDYDGSSLSCIFSITTDGSKMFKLITFGCTDYNNNLWFVDLSTERVMRINYETQTVDYSRVVEGACSVYADPFNNVAYIYIVRDPEFPNSDCIKKVCVGDYDYITPEVVCEVPGIAITDPYNVNLYGRSTYPTGYHDILAGDTVWAESILPWQRYSAGSPSLPKGCYKQLKLTLLRKDVSADSPEVEYIRIPTPAVLNKIPWKGYRNIFVDTIDHEDNIALEAGDYTVDLLVWWPSE